MAIIDRVKYDGPRDVFVWRWAQADLSWGTQVIVNQSQEALFYKGGQALDLLKPGTHTLRTANIPLLRSLIKIPFGGETPFAAEIYYINKATNLNLKWGTKEPIPILDPKYNVFLPIRAFGQMGIRISDSRKFIVQLAGTSPEFDKDAITEYFRGVILTKSKDYIAEQIIKQKINLLEISAFLEEISQELHKKLSQDFARFGVTLATFYLNSINVPEEDETVKKLKKVLAEKAEYDILGGDVYKTKRTFDTMETAAGTEGGTMGGGMGLGMGLGAGAGVGGLMGTMMAKGMAPAAQSQQPQQPPQQVVTCSACNSAVPATSKFCTNCGKPVMAPSAKCPTCKGDIPAGAKFCGNCGHKMGPSICGKCQAEVAPTSKFCPSCGKKI
ncbi:SPFH domain-containing protein [Elusimicrobiota bacterium]